MRKPFTDLTGREFGLLTVIGRHPTNSPSGDALWSCKCACGNPTSIIVRTCHLLNGHTKSCGCIRAKINSDRLREYRENRPEKFSAGDRNYTEEEKILNRRLDGMRKRCYNPNYNRFSDWGGRGITICDEWMEPVIGRQRFIEWAKKSGFDPKLTIDRINNDGPYSPNNCRWVTMKEQFQNCSRSHAVEIDGKIRSISDWSKISGVPYQTLLNLYHSNFQLFLDTVVNSQGFITYKDDNLSSFTQIIRVMPPN